MKTDLQIGSPIGTVNGPLGPLRTHVCGPMTLNEIAISIGFKTLDDLHAVRDWMAANTRHFASIWIGFDGHYGIEAFQFNGLFDLVADHETAPFMQRIAKMLCKEPLLKLRARFEDNDEALLFKLTFGG